MSYDWDEGLAIAPVLTLSAGLLVSGLVYKSTDWLIPALGPGFVSRGLSGIDLLKGARNKVAM